MIAYRFLIEMCLNNQGEPIIMINHYLVMSLQPITSTVLHEHYPTEIQFATMGGLRIHCCDFVFANVPPTVERDWVWVGGLLVWTINSMYNVHVGFCDSEADTTSIVFANHSLRIHKVCQSHHGMFLGHGKLVLRSQSPLSQEAFGRLVLLIRLVLLGVYVIFSGLGIFRFIDLRPRGLPLFFMCIQCCTNSLLHTPCLVVLKCPPKHCVNVTSHHISKFAISAGHYVLRDVLWCGKHYPRISCLVEMVSYFWWVMVTLSLSLCVKLWRPPPWMIPIAISTHLHIYLRCGTNSYVWLVKLCCLLRSNFNLRCPWSCGATWH